MDCANKLFWLACITIILCNEALGQVLSEGEPCKTASEEDGICLPLLECPHAIENIKHDHFPKTCSFNKTTPIICCSSSSNKFRGSPLESKPIREKMCLKYGKLVAQENVNGKNEKHLQCYKETSILIDPSIVQPKQYPHLALIGFDDDGQKSWLCVGNLISERYILTVAHCLRSIKGSPKYVLLGDFSETSEKGNSAEYSIEEIILHPRYHPKESYNDIGLIKLNRNVMFSSYIRPACLETNSQIDNSRTVVAGMELMYEANLKLTVRQKLVEITSWNTCNDFYKKHNTRFPQGINNETQICVQSKERADQCIGVSGSPLQVQNSDVDCMTSIIGLTSMSASCRTSVGSPEIHTRISPFLDWIEHIVWL